MNSGYIKFMRMCFISSGSYNLIRMCYWINSFYIKFMKMWHILNSGYINEYLIMIKYILQFRECVTNKWLEYIFENVFSWIRATLKTF